MRKPAVFSFGTQCRSSVKYCHQWTVAPPAVTYRAYIIVVVVVVVVTQNAAVIYIVVVVILTLRPPPPEASRRVRRTTIVRYRRHSPPVAGGRPVALIAAAEDTMENIMENGKKKKEKPKQNPATTCASYIRFSPCGAARVYVVGAVCVCVHADDPSANRNARSGITPPSILRSRHFLPRRRLSTVADINPPPYPVPSADDTRPKRFFFFSIIIIRLLTAIRTSRTTHYVKIVDRSAVESTSYLYVHGISSVSPSPYSCFFAARRTRRTRPVRKATIIILL